jgi:hypothetical protein
MNTSFFLACMAMHYFPSLGPIELELEGFKDIYNFVHNRTLKYEEYLSCGLVKEEDHISSLKE